MYVSYASGMAGRKKRQEPTSQQAVICDTCYEREIQIAMKNGRRGLTLTREPQDISEQ